MTDTDTAQLHAWLSDQAHLPKPLRDFHDAKDLFKTMHELWPAKEGSTIAQPSWVEGQCYVMDMFLRFMALHGYTLQRSRRALPYRYLTASLKAGREARMKHSPLPVQPK